MPPRLRLAPLAAALATVFALLALGCMGNGRDLRVTGVRAFVLESAATVEVEATTLHRPARDRLEHEVLVTWRGTEPVMLADARFTHVVTRPGDGALVITGRGCEPHWDSQREQVTFACTDDLQLITLEPGDTHAYPVTVYTSLGSLTMEDGRYRVDQPIAWSTGGATLQPEPDAEAFTVRLGYKVAEAPE